MAALYYDLYYKEYITKSLPLQMKEEILTFTVEHLDECANLAVEVFNGELPNQHWTRETARVRLQEIFNTSGFVGLVCRSWEMQGFVVGICEQWENTLRFELKTICVRSDRQGHGIGTNLLQQLVNTLKSMNVNSIYLLTSKDGLAEAFYTKNGFQRSPRMIFMSHQLIQ
ncbi:GNAT family N-acetyltransferase [Nostoc sp. LPT]|uniref:GNAT family N-acetyltransferase n=1 Tax=Nostoc sp. LPT TaxID=2815387 RepID=UPI001DE13061|nr:GNAT family N-acetyltransferase [Nostoc sp. LPT]MBN4007016.1 GNAT family N-acetyltransferase [Nostoc sp. LPT]